MGGRSAEPRRSRLSWLYVLGLVAAVMVGPAFVADLLLLNVSMSSAPGDVRHSLAIAEPFGHGAGVLFILFAIYAMDPAKRPMIPRITVCAFFPGLMANAMKLSIGRYRPNAFTVGDDVWQSFTGWFPPVYDAEMAAKLGRDIQSFPSGHTATAVGLAIGLCWAYRRGYWFPAMMAVLVGCQRIVSGAHYLSDVLAGLAMGAILATAVIDRRLIGRWFAEHPADNCRRNCPPQGATVNSRERADTEVAVKGAAFAE